MSLKKIIGFGVLLIIVVVAGAFIYLSINYSSIVKAGVESYGPQYTQTSVSLDGVKVSPFAGEVGLEEFLVGNPKDYKTSHAFKVREVKVSVDLSSLTADVIRIREIVIDSPDIIYELGGPAGSNLQTIQQNVAKASGPSTGAQAKPASGEGRKVTIDNLYIRKPKVALSAGVLAGKTIEVPVPDIHLKDIGKDGKGATMADATEKVMDELIAQVTKAAKDINIDAIKKQVEGLTKGTGDLTKGVGDATKGVTDGLKGMFGK
ncbi:MAG: AsmA family protein [Alphaproteobacteria bacterium]|nr:AsmA family protein [Alphaproteobacteria bacterium]